MSSRTSLPSSPGAAPPRVLVVEDNAVNQQLVLAMLARTGYLAEVAADGREALAMLRVRRFDLVLMDLQMPVMDGLQATRELRQPGSGVLDPAVPVIALTANAFAEDRARSFAAGMNDFLTKPIDPHRLQDTLAKWLAPQPRSAVPPAAGHPGDAAHPPGGGEGAGVEVLDRAGLLERAMDDAQLAADLLEAFLHESPGLRDALRAAIGQHDVIATMNVAHTIKGAAGNVGARRVALAATRLEQQAASGPAVRLAEGLEELERHLADFAAVAATVPLGTARVGGL
jgi:CheY-like chemotaxis protein/HPt (histidine-containing phosphotransfer) domain-containing protein